MDIPEFIRNITSNDTKRMMIDHLDELILLHMLVGNDNDIDISNNISQSNEASFIIMTDSINKANKKISILDNANYSMNRKSYSISAKIVDTSVCLKIKGHDM